MQSIEEDSHLADLICRQKICRQKKSAEREPLLLCLRGVNLQIWLYSLQLAVVALHLCMQA